MRLPGVFIAAVLVATGVLFNSGLAPAQSYPTRPVRIITAGAGTFHDLVARHLAQRLGQRWGQGVIVENQPAAGLTIGAKIAANAAPDGYTLFLGDSTSLAAAPSLHKNLGYDPIKSFRPITLVARVPSILVAHPSVPASNLQELIDYARRVPDPILFASAGHGTMTHRAAELFRQLTEANLQVVQYKGGGPTALAVLSGEAKLTALSIPTVLPHIKAGTMKAFALAGPERFPGATDIPTAAEAGLPGFEAEQWVGMLAPAGTPDTIIDRLNHDIGAIIRTDMLVMLRTQGAEAANGTPAEFASFIAAETAKLKKLIETAKLQID